MDKKEEIIHPSVFEKICLKKNNSANIIMFCPARERANSAHPFAFLPIENGSPTAECCAGEPVLVGAQRVLSLDGL